MSKTTVLIDTALLNNILVGWELAKRRAVVLSTIENFGRQALDWTDKEWEDEIGFIPTEDDHHYDWRDIEDSRTELLDLLMPAVEAGITNWTMGEDA